MKYFKCGKCKSPYKIDESTLTTHHVIVTCNQCNAKNVIRLGPILNARSLEKEVQFFLKEGVNLIGRKTKDSNNDFQIEDDYVSRKHVSIQIEKIENKYFITIEDVGSQNGTYNKEKKPLKKGLKYPFLPNDYFIIGLTKITIKFN